MQIIYVIDPSTNAAARVHIGCEAYRELFLDFIISRGFNAAITDEVEKPTRTPAEESAVNQLMEAFHNDLNSRVLN
jgi:hypothetical protein